MYSDSLWNEYRRQQEADGDGLETKDDNNDGNNESTHSKDTWLKLKYVA